MSNEKLKPCCQLSLQKHSWKAINSTSWKGHIQCNDCGKILTIAIGSYNSEKEESDLELHNDGGGDISL